MPEMSNPDFWTKKKKKTKKKQEPNIQLLSVEFALSVVSVKVDWNHFLI